MRRISAALAVILVLLFAIPARAAGSGFYAEYSPPPEHGSLFTVDICARQYTSAAVFRLDYDTELIAYRSVEADRNSSTVKAEADEYGLKIVFCDSEGVSGKLFRLTLKWIGEGTADFTLSMLEGVDDRLEMLDPVPDFSFIETFGDDDPSGSVSRRTSSSSRETRSGSRSSKTYISDDDEQTSTRSERRPLIDLSGSRETDYFLLGVCAAALAAVLIVLGFILGRRIKNKKPSTKEDLPTDFPNDGDNATDLSDEDILSDDPYDDIE